MESILEFLNASPLDLSVFIDTICAYIILNYGIWVTKGKGQNFFTWFLWFVLDAVLYIMIKEEKGLATILVYACMIGSFATAIHLIKYKKNWTISEWRTLFFVVILFLLIIFSEDNRTIIIFGVISEMVAGWPLIKETWKDPDDSGYTLLSYIVFLVAYILTIMNSFMEHSVSVALGKEFVEDILFPLSFIIFSFFDTFPLLMRWLRTH